LVVVKFLLGQGIALITESDLLGCLAFVISGSTLQSSLGNWALTLAFLRLHGGWEAGHPVEVRHACLAHRNIHHALVIVILVFLRAINGLDVVVLNLQFLSGRRI
jgi:hypothetical protein